ncbi:MAG: AI-2E family transporter, partial [Pseudomonadota bacterium]
MTFSWREGLRLILLVLLPITLVLTGLVLLKEILLPFLVGMAAAYMLDPAADRLERLRFSRTAATALITCSFFVVLTVVLLLLLPPLVAQAGQLAKELPGYVEQLRGRLLPLLTGLIERFSFGSDLSAEGLIREQAGQAMGVVVRSVTGLLQSGVALLNLVALLFVTPIVTFYMLRDWDRMIAQFRSLVPPRNRVSADRLGREIDEVLAGFLRG